eukprot:8964186-Pyramimonas_sp.AAC.1
MSFIACNTSKFERLHAVNVASSADCKQSSRPSSMLLSLPVSLSAPFSASMLSLPAPFCADGERGRSRGPPGIDNNAFERGPDVRAERAESTRANSATHGRCLRINIILILSPR